MEWIVHHDRLPGMVDARRGTAGSPARSIVRSFTLFWFRCRKNQTPAVLHISFNMHWTNHTDNYVGWETMCHWIPPTSSVRSDWTWHVASSASCCSQAIPRFRPWIIISRLAVCSWQSQHPRQSWPLGGVQQAPRCYCRRLTSTPNAVHHGHTCETSGTRS